MTFHDLHASGLFLMPNAWDAGSARMLADLGFPAIATTSSGHAATLGRADQQVTRDEMLAHATALVAAVDVPVSVDSERCFGAGPEEVARTVTAIAATGAAGCSIEDYDPATGQIDALEVAVERVRAAAEAADAAGLVLTARAEQHLYGDADLADTIARLQAYRAAGAHVVYAPGLVDLVDIRAVVSGVDAPVNVLALPGTPPAAALAEAGVRRISTGGALSHAAYARAEDVARTLRDSLTG
ncbi:MAG: 2-methylisocitrate lyase [Nocardioidaceae bacterium]|nr:2-methylisocitrate lyase [Nocardioidaceae bacterium]